MAHSSFVQSALLVPILLVLGAALHKHAATLLSGVAWRSVFSPPTRVLEVELYSPTASKAFPSAHLTAQIIGRDLVFAEGPTYLPAPHRAWFFSDVPAARTYIHHTQTHSTRPFHTASKNQNGNLWLRPNRTLLACEHATRSLSRIDPATGQREVLIDSLSGVPLNSPNDVVARSDGAVFFTDPQYGAMGAQGHGGTLYRRPAVVRWDPVTGEAREVVGGLAQPNGLAFSPDERTLYVADSGAVDEKGEYDAEVRPHRVYAYDVSEDGARVSGGRVFAETKDGIPDGIDVDVDGNVYVATWEGVDVLNAGGRALAKIKVGKVVANVAFGGDDGKSLAICATDQVLLVHLGVPGHAVL